jgi:glycosyltransferase involved in cell wall biosynthesis
MIARLERSRGVIEYGLAARTLKERWPAARFLIAGQPGHGSDAVALAELGATALEGVGALDDVRQALSSCHVFVYPSYTEGMPRSVLEALAAGRPVITTDAPGCRDTVDDKVSGCLVPAGDAGALAAAMESFLKRPGLIPAAARAARLKAERRFDVRHVNEALLEILGAA